MISPVSVAECIQAWRISRRLSLEALAEKCRLTSAILADIESGVADPPLSTLTSLANALGIPPPWLYTDPANLRLLSQHLDEEERTEAQFDALDPVMERVLKGLRQDRTLYMLVTVLLQSEEHKLIRAAEVSLRSLVKQVKPSDVPWTSRQPGHFEPPSD